MNDTPAKTARIQIQEFVESGQADELTQKEIAKIFGVSTAWVTQVMRSMGIRRNKRSSPAKMRLQHLIQACEIEKLSDKQIGDLIGVHPVYAGYLLRDMGYGRAQGRGTGKAAPVRTGETPRVQIQKLFESGEAEVLSQRQIADRIGVTQAYVYILIRKLNLPYTNKPQGRPRKKKR